MLTIHSVCKEYVLGKDSPAGCLILQQIKHLLLGCTPQGGF